MVGFTPQLLQGGAKFLWLSDVTRFSWSIAIITLIVVAIVEASFYHEDFADLEPGQVALIAIGVGLATMLLGWICGCPAYVFLLWLMLRLMGGALSRSLYAYNQ